MMLGLILPIITFHIFGYYLVKFFLKEQFEKQSLWELLPEIWLFGTASYIFPIILLNLLFSISISYIAYIHYIISLLLFIQFILHFLGSIERKEIQNNNLLPSGLKWYHFTFILVCLSFVILQLLLPLRGWDALSFYLPNALYFYIYEELPLGLNNINFVPFYKSPINSLMLTYSFFVTGKIDISLTPVFFFIYTAILIIKYLKESNISDNICFSTGIIYLLSPFTYIHILEFSYYQDHLLGFYFGISLFYLIRKNKIRNSDYVIGVGISMSILSKISGFTLFPIIFIILLSRRENKNCFYISIIAIFTFLIAKSLSSSFIDYIYFLLVLMSIIVYLGKTMQGKGQYFEYSTVLKIIILPLIISIIWINHLFSYPDIINSLKIQYFTLGGGNPEWYTGRSLSKIFLENAHTINSIQIGFIYFLNYAFIPSLILFKIFGLKSSFENHKELLIWFFLFFSFWLTYHGHVSIRYLQPIVIPMFIVIGLGLDEISKRISWFDHSKITLPFIILQGTLFYYPLFPLSYVFNEFQSRFYLFHQNIVLMFIYVIIINLFLFKVTPNLKTSKSKTIRNIILILTIIIPIGFHTSVYIGNNFDLEESRVEYIYDNRLTVTELTEFISESYSGESDIGIGVNIPGIAFNSLVPILDLQFSENLGDQSITLNAQSESIYTDLKKNNITFIITFTSTHAFYDQFQDYSNEYYFLNQPMSNYTTMGFSNIEFIVWDIL